MPESPAAVWQEFRAGARSACERLAAEMAAAAEDVRSLIDRLQNALGSTAPGPMETGKLDSWERLFGEAERLLFSEPQSTLEKRRPMSRTLLAIERHRLEMSDLVRRLSFP